MRVKYATIVVRSMEESVRFSSDVMGFEVDSRYDPLPGVVAILMRGQGEAMIELIENTGYDVGLCSVGTDVDDVNATVDDLRSKGATISMDPVPTLVGSLALWKTRTPRASRSSSTADALPARRPARTGSPSPSGPLWYTGRRPAGQYSSPARRTVQRETRAPTRVRT